MSVQKILLLEFMFHLQQPLVFWTSVSLRNGHVKKWIRCERKYSNSLWHTNWTLTQGMGWLIAYLDDASRFIVGYGLFQEATSQHSVEVLKQAIDEHGKPASILTDRGIQFYANEAEERQRGSTVFEVSRRERDTACPIKGLPSADERKGREILRNGQAQAPQVRQRRLPSNHMV
jgi:transposase InsO family protein